MTLERIVRPFQQTDSFRPAKNSKAAKAPSAAAQKSGQHPPGYLEVGKSGSTKTFRSTTSLRNHLYMDTKVREKKPGGKT